MIRTIAVLGPCLFFTVLAWSPGTRAGEGGSSNYFPGTYGDYAVATAPEPGWVYANYALQCARSFRVLSWTM